MQTYYEFFFIKLLKNKNKIQNITNLSFDVES
jgi:hypothetical protein